MLGELHPEPWGADRNGTGPTQRQHDEVHRQPDEGAVEQPDHQRARRTSHPRPQRRPAEQQDSEHRSPPVRHHEVQEEAEGRGGRAPLEGRRAEEPPGDRLENSLGARPPVDPGPHRDGEADVVDAHPGAGEQESAPEPRWPGLALRGDRAGRDGTSSKVARIHDPRIVASDRSDPGADCGERALLRWLRRCGHL